jgi:O-antigen ligase
MIRYTLLGVAVSFVLVYTWRDWFKSLCLLVVFMAVLERPDMPRSMFGISGLTFFNIMLVNVLLSWAASRRAEGLRWDIPLDMKVLLCLYLGVVLVAFARMMADRDNLQELTTADLVNGYLLNTLKWVVPALLLFDGCRTRSRFEFALFCILAAYFLLALQVARHISPTVDVEELNRRALKFLVRRIGYHRVDLSTMLAGASWALLAARTLFVARLPRIGLLAATLVLVYGQLLTGGRAGYVAWAVVGLVMCTLRWRAYLPVAAALVVGVLTVFPAVADRLREGFLTQEEQEASALEEPYAIDENKLTAGRILMWPHVIEKIKERPLHGYGRLAWRRTGLADLEYAGGHPHNAYLELLLDSGLLGFGVVMAFYVTILFKALRLFLDSRSSVFVAAGGTALALVLAQLVGGMGAQTFYPREGSVGMWCALMLMLRVWVERSRASSPLSTRVRTALAPRASPERRAMER